MHLSDQQINDYQKFGVIIIKDVFKEWIEPLRIGFQKVLDKPSRHGRENVSDNQGRFFEDYCNWERIEEFKNCIFNSPAAQIVAEATLSKSSQIFKTIEVNKIIRENLTGKNKLIFLDACRNNALNDRGLAPINVGLNTLISYSSESGGVSFDGEISPYTKAILNNINKDKDISLILRSVRDEVMNTTKNKQIPWEYSNLSSGELILKN